MTSLTAVVRQKPAYRRGRQAEEGRVGPGRRLTDDDWPALQMLLQFTISKRYPQKLPFHFRATCDPIVPPDRHWLDCMHLNGSTTDIAMYHLHGQRECGFKYSDGNAGTRRAATGPSL